MSRTLLEHAELGTLGPLNRVRICRLLREEFGFQLSDCMKLAQIFHEMHDYHVCELASARLAMHAEGK